MARTMHITEKEISQACKYCDEAITAAVLHTALSVVLMVESGFDAAKTAEVLGTSRRTVFRKREEFRHRDGISRNSWGGRRRFSLSIAQQSRTQFSVVKAGDCFGKDPRNDIGYAFDDIGALSLRAHSRCSV
ncbi:MAG: hypothetical protein AYP45_05980 [Candidatus Brocadia carolinensis]|uniref:Uncharacterized protein n=1 Tax=Candidatus Brocadia carolinensis TaxID=1004156 RepID=A0A1V4AV18_9BACT|nr:MAG: hypothetical protein AYP45_05980 [Candidatus Brocadia caroliniensis]